MRLPRSGEGLHRFADPADGNVYLYSDLETFDAHRVYACFDQPDLKAHLRADRARAADWMVVSNMALTRRRRAGDGDGARALALPADAADVDVHHARVGRA